MMKDTRVLSCVAWMRRRKEIIAAELVTWNLLDLPAPTPSSPSPGIVLLQARKDTVGTKKRKKLIPLTMTFRNFKDITLPL